MSHSSTDLQLLHLATRAALQLADLHKGQTNMFTPDIFKWPTGTR